MAEIIKPPRPDVCVFDKVTKTYAAGTSREKLSM